MQPGKQGKSGLKLLTSGHRVSETWTQAGGRECRLRAHRRPSSVAVAGGDKRDPEWHYSQGIDLQSPKQGPGA